MLYDSPVIFKVLFSTARWVWETPEINIGHGHRLARTA